MGWKYKDLSDEEKNELGWELPDDWTFDGSPTADCFSPIYVCPFCGEECVFYDGGCKHIAYIDSVFTGEIFYINEGLVRIIERRLKTDFLDYKVVDGGMDKLPYAVDKDGNYMNVDDLFYPDIKELNCCVSNYHASWPYTAYFLPLHSEGEGSAGRKD